MFKTTFAEAFKVLFGDDSRNVLAMSSDSLGLSCLLLDTTSRYFSGDSSLSSLIPLSLNEFSIADFLVFFTLSLDDSQLVLLKHFHLSLFKSFLNQYIEHWFDLSIEVK